MKHVIIGASAAGINCAEKLRQLDNECEIIVISKDESVYSRCMLHHVISGGRTEEGISFVSKTFFEDNNITWLSGEAVKEIDVDGKNVVTDNHTVSYDNLLIASGASSFFPPIPGLLETKEGVFALRNIEDAKALKEVGQKGKKAVVIGAGLVGLDATVGLLEKGVEVHLVEMADRILPIQLDSRSASTYEAKLEEHGAHVYTDKGVKEVLSENETFKGVRLNNGDAIEADFLVVAAGVRANLGFVPENLKVDRFGLLIDEYGKTNLPHIYGAGDVCGRAPIWPIAVKQGKNAAYNMVGQERAFDDVFSAVNSMNFFDIPSISIGRVVEEEGDKVNIYSKNGIYKKIITKDGVIIGAVLQGSIAYCGVLTQLVKKQINIATINKDIFNIGYADFFHEDDLGRFSFV